MGRETKSTVTHGGATALARLHLDSETLTIGPPVRAKLALAGLAAEAGAAGLTVEAGRDSYLVAMSEKEAAAWARAIRHPPSLADKLGVKPGVTVALIGDPPEPIAAVAGAAARHAAPPTAIAAAVTLATVTKLDARLLAALARALPPKGAVWLVYEKGVLKGDDLIAAARAAGLKDTKVAKISETHAALRFVARV